jgi:serine/threonine protein kinase
VHEEKVRLFIKSEEAERNPSPEHFGRPRKRYKNDRSAVRLTIRYPVPLNSGKLALVFELMEMNLYEALKNKKNPLTFQKIKFYMFQVLRALDFMHRKGIFHRDIKP